MALSTSAWTLAELDRLPDDGNAYALVSWDLFVTPPPSPAHEQLASALHGLIALFVWTHGLGRVYTPKVSSARPIRRWSRI